MALVTVRLAHPLSAAVALRLGIDARDYAVDETVAVDSVVAHVLDAIGYIAHTTTSAPQLSSVRDAYVDAAVEAYLLDHPAATAPATPTSRGAVRLANHLTGDAENPRVVGYEHFVVDSDPRLSDKRDPNAHRAAHAHGGGDEIIPEDIGAVPTRAIGEPGGVAALDPSGHVPIDQLPTKVQAIDAKADIDDPRLADPRTPLPHRGTHAAGGVDPITPADIGALTPAAADARYVRSINHQPPDADGNIAVAGATGASAALVLSVIWTEATGWPPRTTVTTNIETTALWIGPANDPPSVGGAGMAANDIFISR